MNSLLQYQIRLKINYGKCRPYYLFLKKISLFFSIQKVHDFFGLCRFRLTMRASRTCRVLFCLHRTFYWQSLPQVESSGFLRTLLLRQQSTGTKKPVFTSKRFRRFRKSFPPKSLLCLYMCRNSGKHGGAFSVHCIAGRPTWKAVAGSRAPFGYYVLFWNVFLLDLAW